MKRFVKRPTAALMAVIIAAGGCIATGCWGKKGDSKATMAEIVTIEDDTPWYNTKTVELDVGYDYPEYEYCDMSYVGMISDTEVLLQVSATKAIPDDFDWNTGDYTDFNVEELVVFDTDGNKKNTIDLGGLMDDYSYIDRISYEDGEAVIGYSSYDIETGDSLSYEVNVDVNTGSAGTPREISEDTSSYSDDSWSEGEFEIEGYTIAKYYTWDESGDSYYTLDVTSPSGSGTTISTRDTIRGTTIWDISSAISEGDGKALLCAVGDEGDLYLELDLASASLSLLPDEECDWLSGVSLYGGINTDDMGYVFIDQEGIKNLDFDNKEIITVIDFNCTNLNRITVSYSDVVSVGEDEAVLFSTDYESSGYFSYNSKCVCTLTTIEKAETNPNVGKTVLKVCEATGLGIETADAICRFNEQSDEYFLILDTRYDYYDSVMDEYYDAETEDDYMSIDLEGKADLSDQLSIDMMNGEGPDILLGTFDCSQLNNDDYLTDLTSYLEAYGTDDFFANVIEASRTDDCLYQIPLCFSIQGIVTDKDNVENGQIGFTYNEYLDFVDDVCNGDSPVAMGKNMFFVTCMNAMDDVFFNNGEADFNCDEFEDLADFCDTYINDEVPQMFYSASAGAYYSDVMEGSAAAYQEIMSFNQFIDPYGDYGNGRAAVLGLPSNERRGAQICVYNSIGISASTSDPDGCWAFIEYLLDYETQLEYADFSIPLNVQAFEEKAQESVEDCNNMYGGGQMSISGFAYNDGERYEEMDESVIDSFEDIIASCSHAQRADQAISIIVSEEMPAFFEGQKSLDEVVDILQDRVQTVLDERG